MRTITSTWQEEVLQPAVLQLNISRDIFTSGQNRWATNWDLSMLSTCRRCSQSQLSLRARCLRMLRARMWEENIDPRRAKIDPQLCFVYRIRGAGSHRHPALVLRSWHDWRRPDPQHQLPLLRNSVVLLGKRVKGSQLFSMQLSFLLLPFPPLWYYWWYLV